MVIDFESKTVIGNTVVSMVGMPRLVVHTHAVHVTNEGSPHGFDVRLHIKLSVCIGPGIVFNIFYNGSLDTRIESLSTAGYTFPCGVFEHLANVIVFV